MRSRLQLKANEATARTIKSMTRPLKVLGQVLKVAGEIQIKSNTFTAGLDQPPHNNMRYDMVKDSEICFSSSAGWKL